MKGALRSLLVTDIVGSTRLWAEHESAMAVDLSRMTRWSARRLCQRIQSAQTVYRSTIGMLPKEAVGPHPIGGVGRPPEAASG